jgi:hypothetical protein
VARPPPNNGDGVSRYGHCCWATHYLFIDIIMTIITVITIYHHHDYYYLLICYNFIIMPLWN